MLLQPSEIEIAHSQKLTEYICQLIKAKGKISFAEFMQIALYEPQLGYYSAGLKKFGKSGDFVTAPEISPLFSQCLAKQCEQVLAEIKSGCILELGAGTGKMAADILLALEQAKTLPKKYFILEISPELKDRQIKYLTKHCLHLMKYVEWIDQWPKNFEGVVLANEALDAMPIHRFALEHEKMLEYFVNWNEEKFIWQTDKPSSIELENAIRNIKNNYLADVKNYISEINLYISGWINSLNDCLKCGAAFLIDYGFPAHEYYHPQRNTGTLMCHYHHHAHPDPLIWVGLQDITAHVDFTAVAESAYAAGLQIAGFTTQASFLLNCGLTEIAAKLYEHASVKEQLEISQKIQKLTQPHEMGELFKVIGLTKNFDADLRGFARMDLRHKLYTLHP